MKISYDPESECVSPTTATLGTFDGVHIGHQALLKRLVQVAHETNTVSAVLTFNTHPLAVIRPERAPKLLSTLDEKLAAFASLGVEQAFVLTFTPETARMQSGDFIRRYLLDCLCARNFIAGYDHHFGKDEMHIADRVQEIARDHHLNIEIIPPVVVDGTIVKSSLIRSLIHDGSVGKASEMLGYAYSFAGNVIPGRGIGKTLGFPTANIRMSDADKILPANGVYAGWIEIGNDRRDAVIAVGPSPTFGLIEELIEVHIPGYEQDLYANAVRIGFRKRLRDIVKFPAKEELIRQIRRDIEQSGQ